MAPDETNPPFLSPEFAPLLDTPLFERLDLDVVKEHRVPLPGLGSTAHVHRTDLRVSGTPPVQIRTHQPQRRHAEPCPCVLSIHGGGFIVGSLDMDDPLFERWSGEHGIVGVSVNYRLSPETPYPGPLEDCYRALEWTYNNASQLSVDPDRIGIYGASAGGGLAAGLALLARDRGVIPLAFQLLEAPMLDDRRTTASSRADGLVIWSKETNEFGWRCYLGPLFDGEVPGYAAPARAENLAGLPPTFISVGGADGFRDEDVEYALRLSRAGVPTEMHVYPGAPHGYQMFVDTAAAGQGRRDCDEWLVRTLGA